MSRQKEERRRDEKKTVQANRHVKLRKNSDVERLWEKSQNDAVGRHENAGSQSPKSLRCCIVLIKFGVNSTESPPGKKKESLARGEICLL